MLIENRLKNIYLKTFNWLELSFDFDKVIFNDTSQACLCPILLNIGWNSYHFHECCNYSNNIIIIIIIIIPQNIHEQK